MPTARSRRDRHRRSAFAVLAVTLTACSSATGGADDTSPQHPSSTAIAAASQPVAAASDSTGDVPPSAGASDATGEGTTPPSSAEPDTANTSQTDDVSGASPLDEYVTGLPGSTTFDPARYQRESRAHEEAIARCMAAEGFEYVPHVVAFQWTVVDDHAAAVLSLGGPELPDLPPDEFAAQFGYGLSTREPRDPDGDADSDPNSAIVDAMSVAERVAYYQALLGAEQSLDEHGRPNAEMPGDPASCWEQAATEVWGDRQAADATDPVLAAFDPLLDQIASIEDRIATDPRMVAADEAWSACMADAGFPGYTDLNAPQSDVAERAREVMGTALDPAGADPDDLAELQRFEIEIATADHECRAGYGETYQQVRHDLETQFVEQHRIELEQYRDAVAAQAAG